MFSAGAKRDFVTVHGHAYISICIRKEGGLMNIKTEAGGTEPK